MTIAKIIAVVGVVVMGIAIVYAVLAGDFSAEGGQLLAMPWGVVSLVDLYTGFILFSMWIIFREKSLWRSVGWVTLLLTLGFFIGALYTFLALHSSGGSWPKFWLGRRYVDAA